MGFLDLLTPSKDSGVRPSQRATPEQVARVKATRLWRRKWDGRIGEITKWHSYDFFTWAGFLGTDVVSFLNEFTEQIDNRQPPETYANANANANNGDSDTRTNV